MKRVASVVVFAFAVVLFSVNVQAESKPAPAKMVGQAKISGKAAIACNYERDLWMGHKYDLIPTYILPTYTTHHTGGEDTVGADGWKAWAMNQKLIGGDACPGVTRIIETKDLVIFMRHSQTPDPKDPKKMINHTHCDIWRFEGKKIAEHWA